MTYNGWYVIKPKQPTNLNFRLSLNQSQMKASHYLLSIIVGYFQIER